MEKDITTEDKIKEAARKVFMEKGYGQARTRDIAEEAGINLALLNYYFRSKEKLFDIIMEESVLEMFSLILGAINDKSTSLSEKIDILCHRYIDSLLVNPNLPLFVMSEIQANPEKLLKKIKVPGNILVDSIFFNQVQQQMDEKRIKGLNPLQILINLISMSVFPVIARPLLKNLQSPVMTDNEYIDFINQRKILIPIWIKSMLQLEA